MDCQTFTKKHDGFVDDTLPGVEMASMRDHLMQCTRCARRDADIRRALLLVRNLPALTVSERFSDRLRARIQEEGAGDAPIAMRPWYAGPVAARLAIAAAVVLMAGIMGSRLQRSDPVPMLRPAIVVAEPAEPLHGGDPAPAFFASMSTGIPMWPALMLAEEGPLLFATTELQSAALSREP